MKDTFNREINYLRISVTDRCDLRCIYCMKEDMEFLPKSKILSSEEINYLCSTFIDLGIKKIRITGGEPLIKKGMPMILNYLGKKINNSNLEELTLTTNGTQLYKFAEVIKKNGIKRINVSLDTLDPKKYLKITRNGNLEQVLEGLNIAKKIGLKIKINTVALKNFNIDEIDKLVHWCIDKKFDITFIEVMPMDMENSIRLEQYYPLTKVRSFLEKRYSLKNTNINTGGPSKYVKIKNLSGISLVFCLIQMVKSVQISMQSHIFPRVLELLKEQGSSDIKLIAGGIIPDEEIPKWKAAGVAGIFGPGSSTGEIIDFIHTQSGA